MDKAPAYGAGDSGFESPVEYTMCIPHDALCECLVLFLPFFLPFCLLYSFGTGSYYIILRPLRAPSLHITGALQPPPALAQWTRPNYTVRCTEEEIHSGFEYA